MRRHRAWVLPTLGLLACHSGSGAGSGDAGGGSVRSPSALSGGCSGTPQSLKGACIFRLTAGGESMLCTEFTGSEYTAEAIMPACAAPSQYTTQPCPSAGLVGKCIDRCGEPSESVGYIYRGTAEAVRRACTGHDPPGYFIR